LAVLLQQRRSLEANQLCTIFDRLLGWYTIFQRLLSLAPYGILPRAKFTLRPSFAYSYVGSVTARYSSCGHQPNFAAWYKKWMWSAREM